MLALTGGSLRAWVKLRGPVVAAARDLPQQRRCFSDIKPLGPPKLKGEGGKSTRLRLAFAAANLPHPEKVKRGGEDSYFACPLSRSFGIADGVGGWADTGADPGEFARALLRFAYTAIRAHPSDSRADLSRALRYANTRLRQQKIQGGSTALFGQLNGKTLSILNLGDSGAMLLRPALRTPPNSEKPLPFPRIMFRSSDQSHHFNCPYQLGSSNAPVETPDHVRVTVRAGDVVIAATDGVFDNLFDHQVQQIAASLLGRAWKAQARITPRLLDSLAKELADQAQRIGQEDGRRDRVTPFAYAAHTEGLTFRGGKLDDTTVLVCHVCPAEGDGQAAAEPAAPPEGEAGDVLPKMHNFD